MHHNTVSLTRRIGLALKASFMRGSIYLVQPHQLSKAGMASRPGGPASHSFHDSASCCKSQ